MGFKSEFGLKLRRLTYELSTVGTVRRKSKRDRNRTQTVMTTTENATSVAKNGYPAMPTATVTTQLRAGKTPPMSAAAAGSADVVEDVNMSSAAAAIVIVRHHHKRSEFLIVAFT